MWPAVEADVCIVGLGTAGAAAAAQCAKRGLKVIGLERRSLEQAGARWVNGVPRSAFDRSGIPRPVAPELRGEAGVFHLVAGWGPERLSLYDDEVLEVDMRHLVARLQDTARQHGAQLRADVQVTGLERAVGGQAAALETSAGPLAARYYVDASGLSGAGLLPGTALPAGDLCAAAQQVHAVVDLDAAQRFFRSHHAAPEDALCFTGLAGGYSILNVRLHCQGGAAPEVGILTGTLPSLGFPSGKQLLDSFVAEHSWIGDKLFGAARAIPLRAPAKALVHGNVAGIGDSVSQVFAAHGSGIGVQLESSKLLAEAIAAGDLQRYSAAWHAQFGATFRVYDWFRRFSQTLSDQELRRLLGSGLLDANSVLSGLRQELPAATGILSVKKIARLARQPWLLGRAASVALSELRARRAAVR